MKQCSKILVLYPEKSLPIYQTTFSLAAILSAIFIAFVRFSPLFKRKKNKKKKKMISFPIYKSFCAILLLSHISVSFSLCCVPVKIDILTAEWAEEIGWETEPPSDAFSSFDSYLEYTLYEHEYCFLPNKTFTFVAKDKWADGWNGGTVKVFFFSCGVNFFSSPFRLFFYFFCLLFIFFPAHEFHFFCFCFAHIQLIIECVLKISNLCVLF